MPRRRLRSEEDVGVVGGDDVAVLGDQAVGQSGPGMLVPMDSIL